MPKTRLLPGRCVHCLKNFDQLTWDHVLPESWYPEGSAELEKWKVPACEPCNRHLGKLEQDLLIKLGLCLDPKEVASIGIPEKVLRSLDPAAGHTERDSKYRAKKREKVISGIKVLNDLPQRGIFPNFGPDPNIKYPEYASVLISEEEVSRFAEKITRGIAFVADSSFIEDGYEVKTFVIEEPKAAEIRQLIEEGGIVFERPPGFVVKRRLVENERVGGLYLIEIWSRFRMYVTVAPKDLAKRLLIA